MLCRSRLSSLAFHHAAEVVIHAERIAGCVSGIWYGALFAMFGNSAIGHLESVRAA